MKLSRLATDDFARIATRTKKMGVDALSMASGVLVNQRSLPELAKEYDVSKQRVHLAVETIRKEYAAGKEECGWMNVELELPHALAHVLAQFTVALHDQPDESARQAAIVKVCRALTSAEKLLR